MARGPDERDPEGRYRYARIAGKLSSIPLLLGSGAMIGWFIGHWLDRRLHTEPWLQLCFVLLGLASAVRSTAQLLKQAQDDLDRM